MRISDWSSDVGSSDLAERDDQDGRELARDREPAQHDELAEILAARTARRLFGRDVCRHLLPRRKRRSARNTMNAPPALSKASANQEIGRASWRERVCQSG